MRWLDNFPEDPTSEVTKKEYQLAISSAILPVACEEGTGIDNLISKTYLAVMCQNSMESHCFFAGIGDFHALIVHPV